MRRRIVLTLAFALIVPAAAWAPFTPKTVTVETLGIAGAPAATPTAPPFTPRSVTVETLGLAGPPATSTVFTPKTVTVEPLGIAGTPVKEGTL